MTSRALVLTIVFWVFQFSGIFALVNTEIDKSLLDEFFNKKDVTILVTDSGLGGIAVCADIEHRLNREHPFRTVKIIFCNALPESDYGYNNMTSTEEKIKVFSEALTGMTKWYSPDIVLIACNTLSVLYDQTEYAQITKIPVISIVEIGVDLMEQALKKDPQSSAIIFGTETTIEANSHKLLLQRSGISEERIVTQACPDLAGEIQSDAASDAVSTMIEFYSDDAVKKLSSKYGNVYAGLCCTHFGYSANKFQQTVFTSSQRKTIIIDPTKSMSNVVFPKRSIKKFNATATSVQVVSRATITTQEIHSISGLIKKHSESTAIALEHYELNKNLFEFNKN